jgi:hypothetical protein
MEIFFSPSIFASSDYLVEATLDEWKALRIDLQHDKEVKGMR